jgi:dihydroneopterin aldolase
MDYIFIEGLKAQTLIGIYDWEKTQAQTLTLNLTLGIDLNLASRSDNLEHTLDYAAISDFIVTWAGKQSHELIEAFAQNLTIQLFSQWPIETIEVEIIKPVKVSGNPTKVGIRIKRMRKDLI